MTGDPLAGLPAEIGRYAVTGVLGRGGMGRVIRGHDPKLKRDVALKLVEPIAVDAEDLDELRFMFHREARSTAQLRHPGIIEVYDYSGPDAELLFLACELVEAPTITEALHERGGPLTPRVTAAIGFELCSALAHAHESKIVHRDLKPDNIFWTPSGRIVLADFGIAKALGDSAAKLGATVQFGQTNLYGSPAYMAPEQISTGLASERSDLYALGTVLFECLTGAQAFQGEDLGALVDNVLNGRRTLRPIPNTAPASLARLMDELLEVDPLRRPATAVDVKATLRSVLDELDVGDPRPWIADYGSLDELDEDANEFDADPEADIETALFQDIGGTIRIQRDRLRPRPSQAPFVFAMVTIAAGLGLGVTLLYQLVDFPDMQRLFSDQNVSFVQPDEDIFLVLRFPGRASVVVDGFEMGNFNERIRVALTPGSHAVRLVSALGIANKEVMLLSGTEPVFSFTEADFEQP
ncbi:MAG: serine/threonine-protein kinase [Myxococcota bacterium]